jgi:hypothetical protein
MEDDRTLILQLNSIEELFVAPSINPFSALEVDVLGQSGMDVAQKQVLRSWPRRWRAVQLAVQLPADQITFDLAQHTTAALRRYCSEKIEANRLQRRLTVRRSLRQLVGAFIGIAVALAFIAGLLVNPFGLIPAFLRGVLIVLALYACSVLSFDALWSLAFDWIPFVQDNTIYRRIRTLEIVIEPLPGHNPPLTKPLVE